MEKKYFDDYEIKEKYLTATRTITETDVMNFASMSGDMNLLHTSIDYAKDTDFGERIVHGLLGLSICHGLMFRTGMFEGTVIAFLNIENWEFNYPIFFNDTLYAQIEVIEKNPSKSKSDRGIVKFFIKLLNQEDKVVQQGSKILMMKRI